MATRAGAIGNLPWVRGTSQPGVRMAPRGAQHKAAINAELAAEGVKIGGKQFIQKYGLATWTAINSIDTQNQEFEKNIKDIDEGKDKEEEVSTELSTVVKEEPPKLPEEEPEGPDIGTELATEAAIQSKKLLDKKEIKDKLSDEERDFLHGILIYRDLPKQIKDKVDKLLTNKKTTFTENQFNKLAREMNEHYAMNTSYSAFAEESPHTNYTEEMDWNDIYTGSGYEDGFFQKENEYENFKVKLKKITNLPKNETWKPEALEFKDIIEQTDKLIKK